MVLDFCQSGVMNDFCFVIHFFGRSRGRRLAGRRGRVQGASERQADGFRGLGAGKSLRLLPLLLFLGLSAHSDGGEAPGHAEDALDVLGGARSRGRVAVNRRTPAREWIADGQRINFS